MPLEAAVRTKSPPAYRTVHRAIFTTHGVAPLRLLALSHGILQVVDGFVLTLAIANQLKLWRAGGIEAFCFGCQNGELHTNGWEGSPLATTGLRDRGGNCPASRHIRTLES